MNHTPLIYPAVLFILAVLALASCKEEPRRTQAAKPNPQNVAEMAARAELEKRAEVERELRTRTEARLERQEAARNWWQSAALLMGAGSIITLIFGAVLGTRARHESES